MVSLESLARIGENPPILRRWLPMLGSIDRPDGGDTAHIRDPGPVISSLRRATSIRQSAAEHHALLSIEDARNQLGNAGSTEKKQAEAPARDGKSDRPAAQRAALHSLTSPIAIATYLLESIALPTSDNPTAPTTEHRRFACSNQRHMESKTSDGTAHPTGSGRPGGGF